MELFVVSAAVCAAVFASSVLQAQETVTLDITEFGVKPDSGQDASPAVNAVLAKARTIGKPVTIRFPKGRYDFIKASATKAHHIHILTRSQGNNISLRYGWEWDPLQGRCRLEAK